MGLVALTLVLASGALPVSGLGSLIFLIGVVLYFVSLKCVTVRIFSVVSRGLSPYFVLMAIVLAILIAGVFEALFPAYLLAIVPIFSVSFSSHNSVRSMGGSKTTYFKHLCIFLLASPLVGLSMTSSARTFGTVYSIYGTAPAQSALLFIMLFIVLDIHLRRGKLGMAPSLIIACVLGYFIFLTGNRSAIIFLLFIVAILAKRIRLLALLFAVPAVSVLQDIGLSSSLLIERALRVGDIFRVLESSNRVGDFLLFSIVRHHALSGVLLYFFLIGIGFLCCRNVHARLLFLVLSFAVFKNGGRMYDPFVISGFFVLMIVNQYFISGSGALMRAKTIRSDSA